MRNPLTQVRHVYETKHLHDSDNEKVNFKLVLQVHWPGHLEVQVAVLDLNS